MTLTTRPMTAEDRAAREAIGARCSDLISKGRCPTCENFKAGDVYPRSGERTFYEDDKLICLLEQYPRGVGHTIVLSKEHYTDISEMPFELGCRIVRVSGAVITALKEITGAIKVYQVTMCSGDINHLHFQLIPRAAGDKMGGQVFSMPRSVLVDDADAIAALRNRVTALLAEHAGRPVGTADV